MLKTNENIFEEICAWISKIENKLVLFSPFISENIIERLDKSIRPTVSKKLLIRLQPIDVMSGITRPSAVRRAMELGFEVRFNFQLHAKVFWNERNECFFGSANLTAKGLGLGANSNFEEIAFSDNSTNFISNANAFWSSSTDISEKDLDALDEYYEAHKITNSVGCITDFPMSESKTRFGPFFDDKKYTLLHIPQSQSFKDLHSKVLNGDLDECVVHDCNLLNLRGACSIEKMHSSFLGTPFIREFLEFTGEGKRFGELRRWLESNIEDVPTPSRADFNNQLNKVYRLIIEASENYEIYKPNHTEILRRKA